MLAERLAGVRNVYTTPRFCCQLFHANTIGLVYLFFAAWLALEQRCSIGRSHLQLTRGAVSSQSEVEAETGAVTRKLPLP